LWLSEVEIVELLHHLLDALLSVDSRFASDFDINNLVYPADVVVIVGWVRTMERVCPNFLAQEEVIKAWLYQSLFCCLFFLGGCLLFDFHTLLWLA
jgi:hypothetical protein